jgi:hypothetical protein
MGNGNFERFNVPADEALCKYKLDFNGDGRGDCLTPDKPGLLGLPTSKLSFSTGAKLERVANFTIEGNPDLNLKDDIRGVVLMDFVGTTT